MEVTDDDKHHEDSLLLDGQSKNKGSLIWNSRLHKFIASNG